MAGGGVLVEEVAVLVDRARGEAEEVPRQLAVPALPFEQAPGLALVCAAGVSTLAADVCGAVAATAVRALLASGDVVRVAPWLVRDVPPPTGRALAEELEAQTARIMRHAA